MDNFEKNTRQQAVEAAQKINGMLAAIAFEIEGEHTNIPAVMEVMDDISLKFRQLQNLLYRIEDIQDSK
jgi:hypothetical protein